MNELNLQKLVEAQFVSSRLYDCLGLRSAVVLECLARGAGSTNWYYCKSPTDLKILVSKFSPGSMVSFFFDERLKLVKYSDDLQREICNIISNTRDCVVGFLGKDSLSFEVDFVTGLNQLSEFVAENDVQSPFFYGAFPSSDNDGERAVTVVLPDKDGVVRSHPY
jgi:hypothetical protein